jgi:replicative DNA helicase Mcm
MRELKEALILQVFGGVRVAYPDGSHDRGDPHILLLGDPGTAKSSLLEQVENLAPRSTYSSGKGATAAGMTAAAQQDDFGSSEWSLEAGALVLADQGTACVDEIDKVRDDAIDSMHEALSKQQVHVNKAGINARLPTRTALLAAGNPSRGRFDQHEPIADQIDLGPAMLSRFDLLFMIDDQPDEQRDREIVNGMIESRALASAYTDDSTQVDADALRDIEPAVATEIIRAWVAHAKETCTPRIRDDAVREELRDSFTSLRLANGSGADQPVPVTYRKLEGIERLAEASARVRLSDEVEMQDIERARRLIGRSMRDVGMDPENGQFDADIVETGQSQSQKDRREALVAIVEELDRETGKGAPQDDVIKQATDAGFDRSQTKWDLKKLKKKGELYEPQTDHLRTT